MADIKTLPAKLLLKIFEKVASHSIEDISNVKVSCKHFLNLAEHNSVYKHTSLEKFACLPMTSASAQRPFVHEVINDCHGEPDEEYKGMFEWVMTPNEHYNRDHQLYFLKRCRESDNPEILYREGIVQYYQQSCCSLRDKVALENLNTAAQNGHDEAKYVYYMLLMIGNDQDEQNLGLKFVVL
ncbi:putative F-box protein At1g67623 [Gastrolobium bilobum]|uniref:putative F-box protein At1g67623 n=1 Tax=Gastrolobium bilobum TaxID=150636 RepID=UPI002AB14311|nr:putative F-box protein At1g67623 [Gastrolobium bilobum]